MDDGYMVGLREVIFSVLEEFAKGVEAETGCDLVPEKCKFFSPDEGAWEDAKRKHLILESLLHMQEGIYINDKGERLRGLQVFNVPVGEPTYVATVLGGKAMHVGDITKNYVSDLEDEHPREL
jgi:hypothetical protein